MPSRVSFRTVFCPTCVRYVPETELAWICLRPLRSAAGKAARLVEPGGAVRKADRAAEKLYGKEAAAGYLGEPHRSLCRHRNEPGATVCASDRCAGPRDPKLSCGLHLTEECETELTHMDAPARTFSIAGPPGTGKTHYVLGLRKWWVLNLDRFGLTASDYMSRDSQGLFDLYWKTVVEEQQKLDTTVPGQTGCFSWLIRKLRDPKDPGIICSVPDVSGEDLHTVEKLRESQYFTHTSGIIFLVDGDRLARFRGLKEYHYDPMDHVTQLRTMIAWFDKAHSDPNWRKFPIAVCVNKVDSLAKLDSRWDEVIQNNIPHHNQTFDFRASEARSDAIRTLLLQHADSRAIVEHVKTFEHFMYFAIATIGSGEEKFTFRPMNVEDPFLWISWHMGIIE